MAKVMLTGASGFVGLSLCNALSKQHIEFIPVARRPNAVLPGAVIIEDIARQTGWKAYLTGVDVVVHLAARVHVLNDSSFSPLEAYRATNVVATLHLARECASAGVKRFIYLSSIKVNGEETNAFPFSVQDTPVPQDPYAVSKWEAEQGLNKIALETGMEIVIIRPPLVYGPGVKANFLQLMRWIKRGLPLPFASIPNRRDMVYVGNLVDLIICCISDKAAAGQTLLVSDGHAVSTGELIHAIAREMHKKFPVIPFPRWMLIFGAKLFKKEAEIQRLLGSLQIDIEHTKKILDWAPPCSFETGIRETVEHFLEIEHSLVGKRQ